MSHDQHILSTGGLLQPPHASALRGPQRRPVTRYSPQEYEAWGGCSNPSVAKMWFVDHDSLTLPAHIGLLPCVSSGV